MTLFLLALLIGPVRFGQPGIAFAQDPVRLLEGMRLLSEGQQLVEQGRPRPILQGIEKYKEALGIFHDGGERRGEAATLAGIGMAYNSLEEWGNSLKYFEQALQVAQVLGDPFYKVLTLSTLAMTYTQVGQYRKAIALFNQALPLIEQTSDANDRSLKGVVLTGIGSTYVMLGEQQKGFAYLDQALVLKRNLGDRSGEAQVLNLIGATYLSIGKKQKALDYLNQSLQIVRAIGELDGEARALGSIGAVYRDLGDNRKALDYYNQVLTFMRSAQNRQGESIALKDIADVYSNMGETAKALDYFNQSLQLKRDASTLNNIGSVYSTIGEYQKSLELFNEALALNRAENSRRGEAAALANIGIFYFELGEMQKALDHFNLALPLMRAMSDVVGEATILGRIGGVYSEMGEKQKSLDYFTQQLKLTREATERSGEMSALVNIGGVYSELGEQQKALDNYTQALTIGREIENSIGVATVFNNIGDIHSKQGENQKALDFYNRALAIVRAAGDRRKEATTLSNMAAVERSSGNLADAQTHIESTLAIIESLRSKIVGQERRASYMVKAQGYYEFYVDLLMQIHKLHPADGYNKAALQASERGRARSLLEVLTEANVDIREGVDLQLLERERSLRHQLGLQEAAQVKLLSGPHTAEQTATARKEIDTHLAELQEVGALIRARSPRYAALTQPKPLDLQAIEAELDADTLLVEYALGKERSYLWAITPTSMSSYQLPARREIEEAARRFYNLLNERNRRIKGEAKERRQLRITQADAQLPEAASALSQMLLSPVAAQLGKKRLIIVADGALQYVPFGALAAVGNQSSTASSKITGARQPATDEYQPLIVEHEIVTMPSASTIAVLRGERAKRVSAPQTFAVLADPVFEKSDGRLLTTSTQSKLTNKQPVGARILDEDDEADTPDSASSVLLGGVRIKRLPYTEQEARRISALVPEEKRMQALGFKANLETAKGEDLSRYQYVHFATHGYLDTQRPELSALVLSLVNERGESQAGFLRAHDIYNLRLPAELVVLSACQTGLGKEIRGEGLVGLTRGFMYAGAPRVVVSLWSVSDQATAELMEEFYTAMMKDKMTPAAALRAAQVKMFRQEKEPQRRAPYYWAAFTLQGEWR